jgi:hypothetical protein
MQYMLAFNEPLSESSKGTDPAAAQAYYGAWGAYIGDMQSKGVLVSGEGLQSPLTATIVRVRDGKRHVQDGPYADVKEHLGGYVIVEVPSLDVALDWAARAPNSAIGSTEVRPVLPPMDQFK